MARLHITRTKRGKGFSYAYSNGLPLQDPVDIERINHLAIPPAWKNVEIAKSAATKVQASGIDAAGRKQYIYNVSFRAKQNTAKFDRIVTFGRKLPQLRERVVRDIHRHELDKQKVTACAVHLMDEAYFRVGNQLYAKEHQTYGLTTLRSKHIHIEGDTVVFDFTGKSHRHQHKEVHSRSLARMLKRLDEMPGWEIFRYYGEDGDLHNLTSADINDYIKDTIGDDYSAKDFRTWGGTLLACMELAQIERPETISERKKAVTVCIRKVASKLGNTPAVTRSAYIDPRVIAFFNESEKAEALYAAIVQAEQSEYVPVAERCALKILSDHKNRSLRVDR